jgi:hypothetical protein
VKAAFLLFVFACASACAQDPGAMAAQQAMQQAMQINQQASQQAIQDMQQASQQASQQMQQDLQNAQLNSGATMQFTCRPTFSVQSGKVTPGTTVRISCHTRHAAIYYTTGGWTPTIASKRYAGPIAIQSSTRLQAFAVGPDHQRGPIAAADYTVQAPVSSLPPLLLHDNRVLRAGSVLSLVTASDVSSKSLKAGDKIGLVLDQDVKVGDTVVAPRGTPVDAAITQVVPAGRSGTPGLLVFRVNSLTVNGTQVPLLGGETLAGATLISTKPSVVRTSLGFQTAPDQSSEAQIKPGMPLTATVAADTSLKP